MKNYGDSVISGVKNDFQEINRFNQRPSARLLQLESFVYPMQQQQWKRQIKCLISQHSLSFKAFRSIFPRLIEVTRPCYKLDVVFELFRQFADNPLDEICGRSYWSDYIGVYQRSCQFIISRCAVTHDALLSSIVGVERSRKLQCLSDIKKEQVLRRAWSVIEENSHLLTRMSSQFFVYSFAVYSSRAGRFPGHAFLVIQYVDKKSKVQYRIFQSFIGVFCLKDYLEKGDNILSHTEFRTFFEGLEELILSDNWTDKLEVFYLKYFNAKAGFKIGMSNPCGRGLNVEWGIGSMYDVLAQIKQFESFKKSPGLPEIEALGCGMCQEKAEDAKEQTQEARARRSVYLEKLDRKLRDTYEKNVPITGQEPIQVDLDSLDLDLEEKSLMDVPARDENGKLIMERRDVRWVEKAVTLRKVTKDVIAELNRLIQHDSGRGVMQGQYPLVLNTNKEPFYTYSQLGLPLNKRTLTIEEEKLLWLRRIIGALINKGHISKLIAVNGHGYIIELSQKA